MSPFAYCLNTSTIRPVPLLRKVRIAAAAGYAAIEPWNDEIDAYLDDGGTLRDLKAALDDAGLRVASVIALGGWLAPEGPALDRALHECRRRMDQAAALGSPIIVASPPREVVDLEFAAARYADLLRLGRVHGVTPAMEFLGFTAGINTTAAALAVALGSRDEAAVIVSDVFHLLRGGRTVDDLLMHPGGRLAIFHVNDVPAIPPVTTQEDGDRVLPGDGVADLPRVVALLRQIGYAGPLSLELFNPTLWAQDPLDVARRGLDRLRALVEGA